MRLLMRDDRFCWPIQFPQFGASYHLPAVAFCWSLLIYLLLSGATCIFTPYS